MQAMQGTLSLRGLQVLWALVLPVLWALLLPIVCGEYFSQFREVTPIHIFLGLHKHAPSGKIQWWVSKLRTGEIKRPPAVESFR